MIDQRDMDMLLLEVESWVQELVEEIEAEWMGVRGELDNWPELVELPEEDGGLEDGDTGTESATGKAVEPMAQDGEGQPLYG